MIKRAGPPLGGAGRARRPGAWVKEAGMGERIVVVGHAAVTCLGRDMDATWRGLVAGRSGLRRHATLPPDAFLQDIAGLVGDFGPGSASEDSAVAKLPTRSLH